MEIVQCDEELNWGWECLFTVIMSKSSMQCFLGCVQLPLVDKVGGVLNCTALFENNFSTSTVSFWSLPSMSLENSLNSCKFHIFSKFAFACTPVCYPVHKPLHKTTLASI